MATKNQLHQLLQEDQEPFHLHEYIADRRTKLRSTSLKNQLRLTRITKLQSDAPTSSSSTLHFPVTFCKNACFNVKNHSPDLSRASPVFHLPKSPAKLLQIPSKTAALLLEAALRIHKTTQSKKHTHRFGTDFSFFGSVLKKLSVKTHRRHNNNTALQTTPSSKSESVKLRRDSTLSDSDIDFCWNGRRSDAVWPEDKSLHTETSCSSSSYSDSTRIVGAHTRSPSRCHSPDFPSRPPSPSRRSVKEGDEEEKEQCSPVCVLDPPFEDGEDDHDNGEDGEDDDGYGLECSSYAIVQRKKQQLVHKLSRLEALADLDPKDLEKLILEDEPCDETDLEMLVENDDTASEISPVPADEFLRQVLGKCGFHDLRRIPTGMERLISDLMAEQEMKDELLDYSNDVVSTVCARFSSWKEVEQNTIDMMVGQDFKQASCKWKTNKEELRLVAMEIELVIYGSLVREVFM